MSDMEKEKFRQIGIDLINEYRQQRGLSPIQFLTIRTPEISAFIRSIQLHEKTKQEFSDFQQEVSDAVKGYFQPYDSPLVFQRFIIREPKRHPLSEVWRELFANSYNLYEFIDALEARGLEIREKGQ